MKSEVRQWETKFKNMMAIGELKKKVKKLKNEMAWALVNQKERVSFSGHIQVLAQISNVLILHISQFKNIFISSFLLLYWYFYISPFINRFIFSFVLLQWMLDNMTPSVPAIKVSDYKLSDWVKLYTSKILVQPN